MSVKMKKLGAIMLSLALTAVLFGCGGGASSSAAPADSAPASASVPAGQPDGEGAAKTNITIGCMPLNVDAVQAIADLMAPQGYTVEPVVFDGNSLPAQALAAGEIDSLILNHLPWINTFNAENGTNLVMAEGFSYASLLGLYSAKHESLEDIPDGAQIIVSNDPANMERSLKFMEKLGFLTLGEPADGFVTVLDIEENTKNIQFIEVETTSTAGSYADADGTISFTSVMQNAGYDAYGFLAEDGENIGYPCGLTVAGGDENTQWVKDIVATTQTPEYEEKFNEIFKGAYQLIK